jgi:hypothetical protein
MFRDVVNWVDAVFQFSTTIARQTEVRVLSEERARSEQQRRGLELRRLRHEQREMVQGSPPPETSEDVVERRRLRSERLQLFLQ